MKEEAREAIVKMFCNSSNIAIETLEDNLKVVLSEVHAPFLLFIECLESRQFIERNNAFDGFFINMLHRSSNTFGSLVALMSTGYLQDAEIIARTLTESSLTIQFLLNGDSVDNLSNYLASYYDGQKSKNDKWQYLIGDIDIHPHNKLIEEKNLTENDAKEICKYYIESVGGQWPNKPKSASIEQVYKALNKEIEYRTVYRAMCGQSHQNPEDLINSFLYSITDDLEIEARAKIEKHTFSIFICLWGMRYFLGALESLGNYYNFESVTKQSKLSLELVEHIHVEVAQSVKQCKVPNGWVNSIIDGI